MKGQAGVGGCVDPDQLGTAQLVDLLVPEVECPPQHGALEAGRPVHRHRHADVGAGALEEGFRITERGSPAPPLDDARVAGFGERVGAEVGAHQDGVRIGPRDLRLGFRQLEPVGNEFPCCHVEFPNDGGVRTAPGKAHQRPGVLGVDDAGAGPHPFRIVSSTQLVHIDQHVPVGGVGAVAGQGGAPPQAARVGGVAPEVVKVVAAAHHVGDPGVGVEHLERLGAHPLELPVAELRQGRLVVRAHPVQRLVAGDVLQPQVGVGGAAQERQMSWSHCGLDGSVSCITRTNEEPSR